MQINVSKRLSFKLVRNTVLLALVLGVVLNVIQVTLDYFSASRVLDEDIQALINITHSPASQIAYNIDVRLAEELLEGLLQHPAVVAAHIVDTDGRKLASRERARPDSPYRALSDLLFQERRHYTDSLRVSQLADMDLGELHITVDTYYYGTAFIDRALFTMLSGFIKTLALSGFLLLIFYVLLTKPLLKVIQSIAQVDA
ncbi:MAG: hybrid sensor histidine kinase/response regulator, partial [Gammaproteobacteria bacterium]|nr:hybrid sensor histidine kinase/response regulator [Gammaproteobacteria bacterium]